MQLHATVLEFLIQASQGLITNEYSSVTSLFANFVFAVLTIREP